MDHLMIDPGEWRTLTPHQKNRIVILKPEATQADAKKIVDEAGNPFKNGKTRITARIELGDKFSLIIHAMWYPYG